ASVMSAPAANVAITTGSLLVAAADQVSSDPAGEAVVLSLRTGMYYGLAQVEVRVWELVRDPIRVPDLRDMIVREYDVEPERCDRDVLDFLGDLATQGLIEIRDEIAAAC